MTACRAPLRAAVGDAFTDEEIDEMLARLSARYERLKAGARPTDADPELWREAFETLAVEEARESLVQQRLKAASAAARAQRDAYYELWQGREGDALRALLVGSEEAGARRGESVDALAKAAEIDAVSRFTRRLQEVGALARLADPFRTLAPDRAFEAEVAREVARLNGEARPQSTNADATRVAEILVEDQQTARARLNRLGAWIGETGADGELRGYISRTTHDPVRVSGGYFKGADRRWFFLDNTPARDDARNRWIAFVQDRLDHRTFKHVDESALEGLRTRLEGEDLEGQALTTRLRAEQGAVIAAARRAWLEKMWADIVSGYKVAQGIDPDDFDGFTPPASLARRLSARRVLHWKDADAWLQYDATYGGGSLLNAHLGFLSSSARNEVLLRTLGPSPETAFKADRDRLVDRARQRGDTRQIKRVTSTIRDFEFAEVSGATTHPGHVRAATLFRALRGWTQMAKLGGMVLTSVTDLGNAGQALSRAGVARLKTYQGLVGSVAAIPDGVVRREVANLVGEGARAVAGDIAAQFVTADANLGLMFKAQRIFYTMNLFSFWQARLRAGAAAILARHAGTQASLPWGSLDEATRGSFERYGIDAPLWEAWRATAAPIDGGRVLTPDGVSRIADVGGFAKGASDEEARRLAQLRVQAWFTDHIDSAMTEPRARERALLNLGTRPGTILGEALRTFAQFKSFPLTVITRHLGPAAQRVARGERAALAHLAHFLSATTVLGFVAVTMGDMRRGIEPMSFTDDEGLNEKLFLRSFIQGGGAGIYADFLFGDYDRFGRSPFATLTGPMVGETERVLRMFSQLREGEVGEAGANAVRFGIDNTPFLNLFYTRWAINYLFLYQLQEELSPGYLERMERKLEEDRGQRFYVPPSQAVNS